MSLEDLRPLALFDGLSDDQLLELLGVGDVLAFDPGEELFREAQPADYWWVLLAGSISLVRRIRHEEEQ
jgi:CRP-like cAMP-binding protein